LILCGIIFN